MTLTNILRYLFTTIFLVMTSAVVAPQSLAQEPTDIVIANGRVMDPESGLDGVRYVGIRGGTVAVISETSLEGRTMLDASGLVGAPGFIDLHAHGRRARANEFQAMDGVTTALELETGVIDMPGFLARR